MLRCINCYLNVDRMLRHVVSSFQSSMQTLLATWVLLQQLPPEAVICHECFSRLNQQCANGNMDAERELGHTHVCLGCGRSVLERRRRVRYHTVEASDPIIVTILSWDLHFELTSRNAYVCHLCWMHATRQLDTDEHAELQPVGPEQLLVPQQAIPVPPPLEQRVPTASADGIILPHYKRTANTSRHCIFQVCLNQCGHLIPLLIKVMLLKQYHIYVPIHSRVCETHLYANEWSLLNNNINQTNSFTAQQIEDLIRIMERNADLMDFENVHEMPNHICHYWTGLNVLEFLTLYSEIPVLENINKGKTCLAIYLTKLRTGDSDNRLSTLYNMPRSTLESHLKRMREYFKNHFVSNHVGLQHITREEVAQRNLLIPNNLFGSPNTPITEMPAIVICDGTYIFIQKSSNYFYQKRTYSLHKYNNLIKPFLIVACDGHIID